MAKNLLFCLWLLIIGPMNIYSQPAENELFRKEVFTSRKMGKLPYRLLYPGNYNAARKYPLVLFLHGAGSQGSDNEAQLAEVPQVFILAASGNKNACFILAPQCPTEDAWAWFPQYPLCTAAASPSKSCQLTLEIIDSLAHTLPIDKRHIYVTGLSLGGEGTFDIITRRPHFFAAAVPVCGIADTGRVELMKQTPLWIFHGDSDDINSVEYSRNIVKALRKKGGSPLYTEYAGVRHDCWTRAYEEPDLLKWMFSQQLK